LGPIRREMRATFKYTHRYLSKVNVRIVKFYRKKLNELAGTDSSGGTARVRSFSGVAARRFKTSRPHEGTRRTYSGAGIVPLLTEFGLL
jgi:hypothetical protein